MTAPTIDAARAEEFAGRMIGVLSDAALALQCSIGHQTGLFDAMAGGDPATSEEIAVAAGLHERYVREWLGAVTTGGIVEYRPENATYRLPPEHASCLTREAGADNLGPLLQFIPMLAQVEEPVLTAFRDGGGVPYSAYTRFHEHMAELSGQVFDAALLEAILPLAHGVTERLGAGIDVADIGCGRGRAVNLMARAYPNSRFTGYDFSEEAVEHARAEAAAWGLDNASFVQRDVRRARPRGGL
jgi:hypothetical protein